ncbi:unnamed protein product, partial [Ectocarpus sp. 4 AP-2014]
RSTTHSPTEHKPCFLRSCCGVNMFFLLGVPYMLLLQPAATRAREKCRVASSLRQLCPGLSPPCVFCGECLPYCCRFGDSGRTPLSLCCAAFGLRHVLTSESSPVCHSLSPVCLS